MKRVLVVGSGKGGSSLLDMLHKAERMNIIAVVDSNPEAAGLKMAVDYGIPTGTDFHKWLDEDIDIIVEATGDKDVLGQLLEKQNGKTVVIPVVSDIETLTGELKRARQIIRNLQKKHISDLMPLVEPSWQLDRDIPQNWTLQNAMEEYERQYIFNALREHAYNKTRTARALNISIRNLYYKLEKYAFEKKDMQHNS
ncbi:helix-turn-helix domain-containing protein [Lentibacillus salinarum]|uniref:Helix-turn-helix domain-containing protein n=1 Tax=Lentibacillus salinarum TaxID=446820 RepID=A0ABW3ZQW0_9BACI